GSGGGLVEPDALLKSLKDRYKETLTPKNLTLVHCTGIGDREGGGIGHLAQENLIKRVIAGNWAMAPKMGEMALDNKIEAYNFPQGVMAKMFREIAAGNPGLLSRVGKETFVDADYQGGRLNEITTEELVEKYNWDGETYLFYKKFPLNVTFIRATTADEEGNLTIEEEGARLELLSMAQATHHNGGIVIAQVKREVKSGTLQACKGIVPGIIVAYLVVHPEQKQTAAGIYNPSFSGNARISTNLLKPMNLNERKVVARRAYQELENNNIVNLGVGMPDGVARIAEEKGMLDKITLTIEQGLVGGIPAQGLIFGVSYNPDAMIDQPYQFDFYHGGGLNTTFLGFGEVDKKGNVNASKLGRLLTGTGGFVDISQNASKVIFCGTFSSGGLKVNIENGKVNINQEGKYKKFVNNVQQITFNGEYSQTNKQEVIYVTERAVFKATREGIMLMEIAPGIDLEKDILNH